MQKVSTIILGAGVTGLAAGIKTGAPIYEAKSYPGGLCYSYQIQGCTFEHSGGHWIFGDNQRIFNFINKLSSLNWYAKNSAVYISKSNLFIPYPIQKNLSFLPKELQRKIKEEIGLPREVKVQTFKEWLEQKFGNCLCQYFFFPFHQKYTAGLYRTVSPQEKYKTPGQKTKSYNDRFAYPSKTLKHLIEEMAKKCVINYEKEVVKIDTLAKIIYFKDGQKIKYSKIISTLPLKKMLHLCNIKLNDKENPYTSLLVVNILAEKAENCPNCHWLYLPNSKSGIHRVGFYSNIDRLFLPKNNQKLVSLYAEKTYRGGKHFSSRDIKKVQSEIVDELKKWRFIKNPKIVDSNWVEVAYTWELPKSKWRKHALEQLKNNNILQIGRYGRWRFQGILKSIEDGLSVKV